MNCIMPKKLAKGGVKGGAKRAGGKAAGKVVVPVEAAVVAERNSIARDFGGSGCS
jgi:hypothetical protein